jgi:hypothetical protein
MPGDGGELGCLVLDRLDVINSVRQHLTRVLRQAERKMNGGTHDRVVLASAPRRRLAHHRR